MSETINNKYAVVQFRSKSGSSTNYIVVSSEWIRSKGIKQYLYWPKKDWLSNKRAVENCDQIEFSTWQIVRVIKIVKYFSKFFSWIFFSFDVLHLLKAMNYSFVDDFYDSIHCCVLLRHFNIDAVNADIEQVYKTMSPHFLCQDEDMVTIRKIADIYYKDDVHLLSKGPI